MTERPILFSGAMVRALLAGTKTQTRRIIKPQPTTDRDGRMIGHRKLAGLFAPHVFGACLLDLIGSPYGKEGDRLWVRETHARFTVGEGMDRPVPECVAYRATCADDGSFDYVNTRGEIMGLKITKWTPAIHMPRLASRITLEITDVRVQRLLDIDEDDARAEGFTGPYPVGFGAWHHEYTGDVVGRPHAHHFFQAWTEINGRESWDANPFVWAISFKRVDAAQVITDSEVADALRAGASERQIAERTTKRSPRR